MCASESARLRKDCLAVLVPIHGSFYHVGSGDSFGDRSMFLSEC